MLSGRKKLNLVGKQFRSREAGTGGEVTGDLEPGGGAAAIGVLETRPLPGLFEYDL